MFVLNVVKILLIFVVVCTAMKKKSKKALVIKEILLWNSKILRELWMTTMSKRHGKNLVI